LPQPAWETRAQEGLEECTWSLSVATDPLHRPQTWGRPSSTVRREWCRFPQEAHLLEEDRDRYRRLVPDEIAILQGFDPSWFDVPGVVPRDKIRAMGDAVPPPLARNVIGAIAASRTWKHRTSVEVCAGSGGFAVGGADAGFEHLLLMDRWPIACRILAHGKPWPAGNVAGGDLRAHDFSPLRDKVGLLSGGPPCQPWSVGGRREGVSDERDLLSFMPRLLDSIRPEVFVFENVPGLLTASNAPYLASILAGLRQPSRSCPPYGVLVGLLHAADHGVPQSRRRVFLLGVREEPSMKAEGIFDAIHASATHGDPTRLLPGRKPWLTLRDAFAGRPDPGGWRRWIRGRLIVEEGPGAERETA